VVAYVFTAQVGLRWDMAAKGVHLLKGKEPLLRQMIFELRYRQGYSYLDKCGKILNRITRELPEWILGNQASPQGTALYSMRNRCRFNFSATRLDLGLDYTLADGPIPDEDAGTFIEYVAYLSQLVIDELTLTEFPRMGLRVLYYFPFDSKEESERWLAGLGVFSVAPELLKAFGAELDAAGLSTVLAGEDCRYRVAFNGVETSAQLDVGSELLTVRASFLKENQRKILMEQLRQKRHRQVNSSFAVVADVDAYLEEPPSPDPGDFSRRTIDTVLPMIRAAVKG
jgi:hypothetical protein